MKNKIVTHFYLKEAKKNTSGEVPIYLRITINGERAELSTNKRISPRQWDKTAESVIGRSEHARTINSSLTTLLGKVEKYYSALDVLDERISIEQIMSELKGKGHNQLGIISLFQTNITQKEELVGIEYSYNTIKGYKAALAGLKEFLLSKYNKTEFRINDINSRFLEAYDSFLRTEKGLNRNSTARHLKNLNSVINHAIKCDMIKYNPLSGYKFGYTNPKREYLTDEEIKSIMNKEIPIKRLSHIRDLFLFQIYTGLSYIDMAELSSDNIETGINGKKWLVIHRKKLALDPAFPYYLKLRRYWKSIRMIP